MVWLCLVTCTSTLSRKKITGARISRPLERLSMLGIAAAIAFPQPPGSQVVFIICLIYTTATVVFDRTVFLDAAGRYFVVRPDVYAKPAGSPATSFRPSAIRNTAPRRLGGEANDG